jgi:hypothetical protein
MRHEHTSLQKVELPTEKYRLLTELLQARA